MIDREAWHAAVMGSQRVGHDWATELNATAMDHFSIRLWHAMKSGFYTTSNDQLSGWTEKKLQSISESQTCTKKRSWSLFGGLLLSDPLELSEFQQNHYIWEVCSANQCIHWKVQCLQPALVNRKGPVLLQDDTWLHSRQQFKSWTNWTQSFASSVIFTWLLTNLLPLLQASQQLFAGKMLPQPAGGRKYFPRVHQILMHRFFML